MEKKIVVPEGMMDAACNNHHAIGVNQRDIAKILEAALRWLSENPIVPEVQQIASDMADCCFPNDVPCVIERWQRRMFLAPEPDVPEEIKNLMRKWGRKFDEAILESYFTSQKSRP